MIIYKPTGQAFKDRKEAKIYFGTGLYNRLVKFTDDFVFTNESTSATNEVYKNTEEVSHTERRN
jgi:hypothetical protein